MRNTNIEKISVYGIIILFIGATVIPSITGYGEIYNKSTEESYNSITLNDDYINSYWKLDECSGDNVGDSSTPSYDGERVGPDVLKKYLENATIANLVGEKTINCAIEMGLIDPDCVIKINGVPHAQMVRMLT